MLLASRLLAIKDGPKIRPVAIGETIYRQQPTRHKSNRQLDQTFPTCTVRSTPRWLREIHPPLTGFS
jgi:hypothetical protein